MRVNENDFRLLPDEPPINADGKLAALKRKIADNGHNITDYYSFLSNKANDEYRRDFACVFLHRCCYCGDSFSDYLNYLNLEIDHILSKSTRRSDINCLENLAPSCHICNNAKRNSIVDSKQEELINPFFLNRVFRRTNHLYIVIRDEYKDNLTISNFYESLGLNREFHRLNYVLIYLAYLKQKHSDNDSLYSSISKIYDIIRQSLDYWSRVS